MVLLAPTESAWGAKRTVATTLVGAHPSMGARTRTEGASVDANVVVSGDGGAGNAIASRLLKDASASHPPGQRCRNDALACWRMALEPRDPSAQGYQPHFKNTATS